MKIHMTFLLCYCYIKTQYLAYDVLHKTESSPFSFDSLFCLKKVNRSHVTTKGKLSTDEYIIQWLDCIFKNRKANPLKCYVYRLQTSDFCHYYYMVSSRQFSFSAACGWCSTPGMFAHEIFISKPLSTTLKVIAPYPARHSEADTGDISKQETVTTQYVFNIWFEEENTLNF